MHRFMLSIDEEIDTLREEAKELAKHNTYTDFLAVAGLCLTAAVSPQVLGWRSDAEAAVMIATILVCWIVAKGFRLLRIDAIRDRLNDLERKRAVHA